MRRVKAMQAGLQTRESCWYLLRLCSLTTIQREWCALHAFPKLAFKDSLLSTRAPDKPPKDALHIPEARPLLCAPHIAACTWLLQGSLVRPLQHEHLQRPADQAPAAVCI